MTLDCLVERSVREMNTFPQYIQQLVFPSLECWNKLQFPWLTNKLSGRLARVTPLKTRMILSAAWWSWQKRCVRIEDKLVNSRFRSLTPCSLLGKCFVHRLPLLSTKPNIIHNRLEARILVSWLPNYPSLYYTFLHLEYLNRSYY